MLKGKEDLNKNMVEEFNERVKIFEKDEKFKNILVSPCDVMDSVK